MDNCVVAEQRNVISFAELAMGDRLVIQTSRSTYVFTIQDPSTRLGTLTGGSAVRLPSAYAVGAVSSTHAFWKGGLRVGERAVFVGPVVSVTDSSSRFVTSVVQAIQVHWRTRRVA